MFSSFFTTAEPGSWIKDEWRDDRSLGYVVQIDQETNMMYVQFPKTGKSNWVVWHNTGHYKVINLGDHTKK
tara:strand:+ start:3453 stop:3665 length:213 start_codon:yes stop_codon:yes gene_type:complete